MRLKLTILVILLLLVIPIIRADNNTCEQTDCNLNLTNNKFSCHFLNCLSIPNATNVSVTVTNITNVTIPNITILNTTYSCNDTIVINTLTNFTEFLSNQTSYAIKLGMCEQKSKEMDDYTKNLLNSTVSIIDHNNTVNFFNTEISTLKKTKSDLESQRVIIIIGSAIAGIIGYKLLKEQNIPKRTEIEIPRGDETRYNVIELEKDIQKRTKGDKDSDRGAADS